MNWLPNSLQGLSLSAILSALDKTFIAPIIVPAIPSAKVVLASTPPLSIPAPIWSYQGCILALDSFKSLSSLS